MEFGGILFHNLDFTINLLDIPQSIEDAQGYDDKRKRCLLSTKPLEQPFEVPEPRSAQVRQSFGKAQEAYHEQYAVDIQRALDLIHEQHAGDWCLSRIVHPQTKTRKRTATEAELNHQVRQEQEEAEEARAGTISGAQQDDLQNVLPGRVLRSADQRDGRPHPQLADTFLKDLTAAHEVAAGCKPIVSYSSADAASDVAGHRNSPAPDLDDIELPTGFLVQNPGDQMLQAEISMHESYNCFYVPPGSRAVLADCHESASLRAALRGAIPLHESAATGQRKFDLILLDPPWPNRSAKRRGSYEVQYNLHDAGDLLYGLELDMHLAPGGFVAIWITNKGAVRDLVLDGGRRGQVGWFDSLGVELIEEWIWVKTTLSGEPVTPLHSMWRKSYEILLIGRQTNGSMQPSPEEHLSKTVKTRIIAAVPDLHSRKPCLRALFDKLLFQGRQYRAMEVFSRYMVSGWWAWGDEAIKYNWTGFWDP